MASNKLEEQATAKGELSYSAWAARAASEAPPPEPKQLSEQEAAESARQLRHTESGASAWNAAGTFEERAVPLGWVREQLGELLGAVSHAQQGASVAVQEVTGCSGEAYQWLVRGRKRANFELSGIEFRWRAQLDGQDAAVLGKARVPHAAADELDELQLEVTPDGEAGGEEQAAGEEQRRAAQAAVRGMLPALAAALAELLERLRNK